MPDQNQLNNQFQSLWVQMILNIQPSHWSKSFNPEVTKLTTCSRDPTSTTSVISISVPLSYWSQNPCCPVRCAPGLVSPSKLALGEIKTRCYFTHMGVTRPHDKPGLGGKKGINSIWVSSAQLATWPSPHADPPTKGGLSSAQLASCCCAFPPLSCFVSVWFVALSVLLSWHHCAVFSFVTACLCCWLHFTNIASACRTACVDLNGAFAHSVDRDAVCVLPAFIYELFIWEVWICE